MQKLSFYIVSLMPCDYYKLMQGNVHFNENGSRLSHSVNIYQYQEQEDGLTLELIGKVQNNTYIAVNMSSIWPDGVPPGGTLIKIVNIQELWVPILGAILQSCTLSFLILCLSFNIIFRKRKIVKLTSPNLNYIMLLGAAGLIFSAVVFRSTSITLQTVKCYSERFLAACGYDICFAVPLVKTLRVFYIFRKKYSTTKVLQDWKLILIIVCIVSFDTIFIILPFNIAALFSDDVKLQSKPNAESGKNDQDVEQNFYIVCGNSVYFAVFVVLTILFKIVLHVIGLVLAFLTRNVEVDALNDAKYSAMIIYFSTFMLILIAIIFPSTVTNPNLYDGVWTIFMFIMVFMFLGLTFIPKMIALYKDPHGKYAIKPVANVRASQLGKTDDLQYKANVTHFSGHHSGIIMDPSSAPKESVI